MNRLEEKVFVEAHNMNTDKLERVHRNEFLRSHPYEIPI